MQTTPDDFLRSWRDLSDPALRTQPCLDSPEFRQELYLAMDEAACSGMLPLLRIMFEKEVEYRIALWEGEAQDDTHCFENIFHCAFLIYCGRDPSDAYLISRADRLNMDVGCLDSEYFVGGGIEATLDVLRNAEDQVSGEIRARVMHLSSDPDASLRIQRWEDWQRRYHQRGSEIHD